MFWGRFYILILGWRLYEKPQQDEFDSKLRTDTTNFELRIGRRRYEINLITWMQTNPTNGQQRKINHEYPSKVRNLVRPTPPIIPVQPNIQVHLSDKIIAICGLSVYTLMQNYLF